jgi:hypothetical protein
MSVLNAITLALEPVRLNDGEDRELQRLRKLPPTIDKGEYMGIMSIGTKVIERLTPFLGRVAKTSPSHWTKLTEALKAKGVAAATTASEIVAYARKSPMNAALVFATIAEVGIAVGDLFSSEDKADPEVRKTAIALDRVFLGGESDLMIAANAARSEELKTGVADREVEIRLVADICNWAKGHFGSARAALDAHQKLQAFVEMPYADVEAGFRLLK